MLVIRSLEFSASSRKRRSESASADEDALLLGHVGEGRHDAGDDVSLAQGACVDGHPAQLAVIQVQPDELLR